MPNSFPFVTNNPSGFKLTDTQLSGNESLGKPNVRSMPNVANPKSIGQPSANGYSQIPTNPKYTPYTSYTPKSAAVNVPQAVQTTATTVSGLSKFAPVVRGLGVVGAILSIPSVASDFASGLGYLFNLPQTISNAFERNRLDRILTAREKQALLQKQARDADSARINNNGASRVTDNYVPPFKGGQSKSPHLGYWFVPQSYRNIEQGVTYYSENELPFGNGARQLAANQSISGVTFYRSGNATNVRITYSNASQVEFPMGFGNANDAGNLMQDIKYKLVLYDYNTNTVPSDTGGDLPNPNPVTQSNYPAPPVYPSNDSFPYAPNVNVNDGFVPELAKDTFNKNSVKPYADPPIPKPLELSKPLVDNEKKIEKTPSGFPKIAAPSDSVPSPVNRGGILNLETPPPVAPPANASKSQLYDAQAEFDKYYAVPYGGKGGFVQGVNSSFGTKGSTASEPKAKGLVAPKTTDAPQFPKVAPTDTPAPAPDTRAPNTTPSTPTAAPSDSNTQDTIAKLLGLTALIAALKVGSDYLVNNSLSTAPKIDNINANTQPSAQQTNAKQGVCDAMQPDACGFQGVQAATAPIKDKVVENAGLLAQILAAIANLASTIATLFANLGNVVNAILNNQFVTHAMNYITMISAVHNAAMLSRGLLDTLGSALDSGLQILGLQLKDKDSNQIGISQAIGTAFQDMVKGIIGNDNWTALNATWINANRVYQTGINLLSNVQSIIDSTTAVAELTNNRLGTFMNAVRSAGGVRENAYRAQSENVNRFNANLQRLQNLEEGVSNLASITGNIVSVQQSVDELKTNRTEFEKALREKPIGSVLPENEAQRRVAEQKKISSTWTIGDFSIVKPPEVP